MAGKYSIESIFSLIDNVSAPTSRVGKALDKLGIKSKTVSNRLKNDFDKAAVRVDKLGKAIKKTTGLMAAAGVAAATAFAVRGTRDAIRFETAIAKIGTVADTTIMPLNKISDGILGLSNSMGISANEIAESMFQITNSGVAANRALAVVEATTRLSRAAFVNQESAISSVTTVLNAYGKSADEAQRITNQMYIATTRGNMNFSEMEKTMRYLIPTAASLGVNTEEVFASLSVLTSMGERTNVSMRSLGTAMKTIIKPSRQAADVARQLGIDFSATALESMGFQGFLEHIAQTTGGDQRILEALFGNIDVARMISKLSTTGAQEFEKTISEMMNTDAVGIAFDRMMDTPEKRWANAMNRIRNSGIRLGTAILPVVEKVIEKVSGVADRLAEIDFDRFTPVVQKAFNAISVFISGIVSVVRVLWQFRGVIIAVAAPLVLYHGALMAITIATTAYTKIMAVKKAITAVVTGAQMAYAIVVKKNTAAQAALTFATKETVIATKAWSAVMNTVTKIKKAFTGLTLKAAVAMVAAKVAIIAATVAQWALNVAMTANPIGLIIVGVGALIAALVALIRNWRRVTEAIRNNTEKVMAILTWLLGPIGLVISMIREIAANWERVREALAATGLFEKIREIAGAIRGFFQPAIDWLVNAFNVVKNAVTGFFSGIANRIRAFFEPAATAVSSFFGGIFGAIYNFVKPALDWLGEKWQQIVALFTDNAILNAIKVIGGTLLSGVLAPIQGLLEILSNIPGLGHLAGRGAQTIQRLRNNLTGRENTPRTTSTNQPENATLAPNTDTRATAAPNFSIPTTTTAGGTTTPAGRSSIHGVVDISGGAAGWSVMDGVNSGTRSATTAGAPPVVPEIVTRNVLEIATILRRIDSTVTGIGNLLPGIIARTNIEMPRIRTRGDGEGTPDNHNPRSISPITQAERMAYSVEERIQRIIIEVAAERGTAARIIRAPRDAEIELVNSGGNA